MGARRPRARGLNRLLLRCAVLAPLLATAAAAAPPADEGFHAEPHLGFQKGDHHVDLRLEFRYRYEAWKAFAPEWDHFHGIRTRFALDYRYRKLLRLFAQGQQQAVLGLGTSSSGVGGLHFSNNDQQSNPSSVRPSQLFVEITPSEEMAFRVGRTYMALGSHISHAEPNWKFLQGKRLSQRLQGSLDWTTGARAFDGGTGLVEVGGHQIYAWLNQPATGVFVVDDESYRFNHDILDGGIHWTAPKGKLLENTQLNAFFMGYSDNRDPDEVAGLFGRIEVYTLGASLLGVYPLGPGRADVLLWGAFQAGDYVDQGANGLIRERDQIAGALVAEFGYQLPDVWSAPWLRLGVNWGSGDDDRNDDTRKSFFNLLPTNHLFYGYTDQLALSNLVNLLVMLKMNPVWKLGLEITYHRFWLQESGDLRWAGTGAFSRRNLGYIRNPSNGSTDVGQELDVLLNIPVHRTLGIQFGFARLWGGNVFDAQAQGNVSFGYAQFSFKY